MTVFKTKSLSGLKTLGERLKEVREESDLSLEEVTKKTGIKIEYLSALELNDYQRLPGELYTKSFLKRYAAFLELNPQSVIRLYEKESGIISKTVNQNKRQHAFGLSRHHFAITPKTFRRIAIFLIIFACFLYVGYEILDSMAPPELTVNQPSDNYITSSTTIEVSGRVEPESKLQINGQEIFSDREGNFSETMSLQEGVNIIEIEAYKKRGRSTIIYRRVLVQNT